MWGLGWSAGLVRTRPRAPPPSLQPPSTLRGLPFNVKQAYQSHGQAVGFLLNLLFLGALV